MSEPVSITDELRARIEELTRECDDRRRRCAMLARAHGALADAGCIVPTEMDETIEHAIEALAKERDEARNEVARLSRLENSLPASLRDAHVEVDQLRSQVAELTRERDAANAKHETLSALVEGYRRERDEARAEVDRLRKGLEPIADGTVWNAKESAEFLLGRKP